MRTLRADNLKLTGDLSRLSEKHTEAQRRLDIAESSEASMKTQLKSAEAAVRGLKDEMARTKALVSQARASCATEVRRRDRQIDTLKKQLGEAGRPRGQRANPAVTTIHVTGDVGSQKSSPAKGGSTAAEDYDLRNETNAFLAKLAQDLGEENEGLLQGMRRAMEQLREMSGFNDNEHNDLQVSKQPGWEEMVSELESILAHMRTILTNPSFVPIEEVEVREEEIGRLKEGWVRMESRWQEAVHLIDGWRKRMAASGRPICDEELKMGLRLSPVRVRDVEETRQAENFGFGLSAVAEEPEENEALVASPCPPARSYNEPELQEQSDGESSGYEDDVAVDYDAEEPNVEILQQSTALPPHDFDSSLDSSPLPAPPQLSPLKNSASAGNRGATRAEKSREKPGDFKTIVEENTWDLAGAAGPPQPPPHRTKPASQPSRPVLRTVKSKERTRSPSRTSLEEALLPPQESEPEPEVPQPEENEGPASSFPEPANPEPEHVAPAEPKGTPRRVHSRLPLPRNADPVPQQSPLTMSNIAAKLAASEREADAARVRAKLKAARGTRGVKKPTLKTTEVEQEPAKAPKPAGEEPDELAGDPADVDPVKHDRPAQEENEQPIKVEKRKRDRRTGKAASRRRSTLSPWELESLMAGQAQ